MTTRDLIYGLIAVLTVYLLFLLVRLRMLTRRKALKLSDRGSEGEDSQTIHSEILGGGGGQTFSAVSYDSSSDRPLFGHPPPKTEWGNLPDDEGQSGRTQDELRQLRQQVVELKGIQEHLLERLDRLEDELGGLRAACQISPAYGEAVALAWRGFDALTIAERCGISVAEAELVMSLSEKNNRESGQ